MRAKKFVMNVLFRAGTSDGVGEWLKDRIRVSEKWKQFASIFHDNYEQKKCLFAVVN